MQKLQASHGPDASTHKQLPTANLLFWRGLTVASLPPQPLALTPGSSSSSPWNAVGFPQRYDLQRIGCNYWGIRSQMFDCCAQSPRELANIAK